MPLRFLEPARSNEYAAVVAGYTSAEEGCVVPPIDSVIEAMGEPTRAPPNCVGGRGIWQGVVTRAGSFINMSDILNV
jgi:hypothetical protein